MPTTTRVNVALPEAVISMINALKGWLHLTQTQAVRESIEFRYWIQEQVNEGATVVLERKVDGAIERTVVWMPPAHERVRHEAAAPRAAQTAR
jgi:hypothetical protein